MFSRCCLAPQDVRCGDGHAFCFKCGAGECHRPATCEEAVKWGTGGGGKEMVANMLYMSEHTKACPKCGRAIQRSEGCNKMRCSVGGCGTTFCWTCLRFPFEKAHKCVGGDVRVRVHWDAREGSRREAGLLQTMLHDAARVVAAFGVVDAVAVSHTAPAAP